MFKKISITLGLALVLSSFSGTALGLDDKENKSPQVDDKINIEERLEKSMEDKEDSTDIKLEDREEKTKDKNLEEKNENTMKEDSKENSKDKKEESTDKTMEEDSREPIVEDRTEEKDIEKKEKEERKEEENSDETSMVVDHHEEDVEYEVIFKSLWSKKTHPDKFPEDTAFSTMVGIVHNNKACLWREGMMASDGLAKLAETGKNGRLEKCISKMKKKGGIDEKFFIKGGKNCEKERKTEIEVSKEYPMVSLAGKMIPSTDWFTGVDSVSLLEEGKWVDKKIVMIYAYDAGTMEGKSYEDKGMKTNPQDKIMRLESCPFLYDGELTPVGCIMFVKDED